MRPRRCFTHEKRHITYVRAHPIVDGARFRNRVGLRVRQRMRQRGDSRIRGARVSGARPVSLGERGEVRVGRDHQPVAVLCVADRTGLRRRIGAMPIIEGVARARTVGHRWLADISARIGMKRHVRGQIEDELLGLDGLARRRDEIAERTGLDRFATNLVKDDVDAPARLHPRENDRPQYAVLERRRT